MKKLLLTFAFTAGMIGWGTTASAQNTNIGVNLATGLPMGDFGDFNDFGIGGGITADYFFNDKFSLGVSVQYLNFAYKEPFDDESLAIIPIQLTAAYHQDLTDMMELYAGTGIGYFMMNPSNDELIDDDGFIGFSPRIGLVYELTDRLFLDLNVNYSIIMSSTEDTVENVNGVDVDVDGDPNTMFLGINLGVLYTIGD